MRIGKLKVPQNSNFWWGNSTFVHLTIEQLLKVSSPGIAFSYGSDRGPPSDMDPSGARDATRHAQFVGRRCFTS